MTDQEEHAVMRDAALVHARRYYNGTDGPQMPDPVTLAFLDQADTAINEEGKEFWAEVGRVERREIDQVPPDMRDRYERHSGAFASLRQAYEAGEVANGHRQAGTMVTAEQTYDPETGPPEGTGA